MSLPVFSKVRVTAADSLATVIRAFVEMQANVARVLDRLTKNPRADFLLLSAVALNGGTNTTIQHKLGRVPQGWSIADMTISATAVRRVSWDKETLVLFATTACAVNLEVW